jgi:hypothetical protein
LGVTAIKLISAKRNARQLSLFSFEMEEKRNNVNQIVDLMKRKYGEQVIQRGTALLSERGGVPVVPFQMNKGIISIFLINPECM